MMMVKVAGDSAAPPMPWTALAAVSHPADWAKPPMMLVPTNSSSPIRKTRRRPNESAARPPSSKKPAKVRT